MKRRRISYSKAELTWIESHKALKRSELWSKFVKMFGRDDVSQDNLECLCVRKGWTTGRRKKGIKPIGWTPDQLDFVEANSKIPRSELHAKFVDRFGPTEITRQNLQSLCSQKGWRLRKKSRAKIDWSHEELDWIKANSGRSRADIHADFVVLFKRPDILVDDIKALCSRNKWKSDNDGRFNKGQVSWNKGKKMPFNENSARTQFKKGRLPHNTNPSGHERICSKDGYVMLRLDEPNPWTGARSYYVHKHRYLWEQEKGPIPDGMCLKCVDGNPQNLSLDNWELISRGVLARLNKQGLYKIAPPDLKPAVITAAKILEKVGQLKGQSREKG